LCANLDGVYERDKRRLANLMAFGQDVEPASHSKPVRRVRQEEEEEVEIDRFQERTLAPSNKSFLSIS
jgi:Uncharacterised protein family (UPF0193)